MDARRVTRLSQELGDPELAGLLVAARDEVVRPVPDHTARRHLQRMAAVLGATATAGVAAASAAAAVGTGTVAGGAAGIGLGMKLVAGMTAVTLTAGGLAANGSLPDPAQEVASETAGRVGLILPHPDDPGPTPAGVGDNEGSQHTGDAPGRTVSDGTPAPDETPVDGRDRRDDTPGSDSADTTPGADPRVTIPGLLDEHPVDVDPATPPTGGERSGEGRSDDVTGDTPAQDPAEGDEPRAPSRDTASDEPRTGGTHDDELPSEELSSDDTDEPTTDEAAVEDDVGFDEPSTAQPGARRNTDNASGQQRTSQHPGAPADRGADRASAGDELP